MNVLIQGFKIIFLTKVMRIKTWKEIEKRVRGTEFDLDFIRDYTDYSWMYRDDEYGRRLWNAIQCFTIEEKTRYLRYIAGITRIQYEPRYSENKHKVYLMDAYRYTAHNTLVHDVYTYNI